MTAKHDLNEPASHTGRPHAGPGPLGKLLGMTLVGLLLLIGLIGLLFPVIPGLLFLFLALYVLTRISRRFAGLANRNSWLRRGFRRLGHIRTLPPVDLLKLGFWVSLRGTVNGITAVGNWLRNTGDKTAGDRWRRS